MATYCLVPLVVLFLCLATIGIWAQDVFPGYKLQHWRFRDQVLSFPHSPSDVYALASSKHKMKAGKPRVGYATIALPSSLAPSVTKGAETVNKLVDKASAASGPGPSYPKYKPRKGGPPHYPPINRKALYATGLIYLRDFRPGGPLY